MKQILIIAAVFISYTISIAQNYKVYDDFSGSCWDKIAYDNINESIWVGNSNFNSGTKLAYLKDGARVNIEDLTDKIKLQNISSLNVTEGVVYAGGYLGAAWIDIKKSEFTHSTNQNYSQQLTDVFLNPIDNKIYAANPTLDIEYFENNVWVKESSIRKVSYHAYDTKNQILWLLSNFGNTIYKITKEKVEAIDIISDPIPDLNYIDIKIGKDNELYLLSYDDGFVHFNGSTWQHYNSSNSNLFGGSINTIEVNKDGILWLGHTGGITKFENGNFKLYNLINLLNINYINIEDIAIDNNNHLWLASCNGLIEFWLGPSTTTDLEDKVTFYPNPTTDNININSFNDIINTTLLDINGNILLDQKNLKEVNLGQYSSGIYFLKFRLKDNTTITKRITKI